MSGPATEQDRHLYEIHACLGIAAICLTLSVASAGAQSVPGDTQRGLELSERFCTNCHSVKANPGGPVKADVPSFTSIANRPGVTPELLAGRIIVPHPAMPGVPLTAQELREIIAYILSLKASK